MIHGGESRNCLREVAQKIHGGSSDACKETQVTFCCRWFIAFYFVTSAVTFHFRQPVACSVNMNPKRLTRTRELALFRGFGGKKKQFSNFHPFLRQEEIIYNWINTILLLCSIFFFFAVELRQSSVSVLILIKVSHPRSSRFWISLFFGLRKCLKTQTELKLSSIIVIFFFLKRWMFERLASRRFKQLCEFYDFPPHNII